MVNTRTIFFIGKKIVAHIYILNLAILLTEKVEKIVMLIM
jgi:hypothetical protein